MSETPRATRSFYERLLKQGFSRDEIAEVHRRLREKGYGEAPSEGVLRRELSSVRRARTVDRRGQGGADAAPPPAVGRRAEDRFPVIPPALRRRINAYARSLQLPIVGPREWLDDLLSFLPLRVPDCVAKRYVERLTRQHGLEGFGAGELSLYDTVHALSYAAQKLMGDLLPPERPVSAGRRARPDGELSETEQVKADLQRRDPFGYRVLQEFVGPFEQVKKHLEYLRVRQDNGERVETAALSEVAQAVYRLCLKTEQVDSQSAGATLSLAHEIQTAYRRSAAYAEELDEAARMFRIARDNLQRYKFELYPVILRLLKSDYPWRPQDPELIERLCALLGVADEDILERRRYDQRQEQLQQEQRRAIEQRELERLEREKSSQFRESYAPVLRLLGSMFPGSGIGQLDQGAFVLPYFERVLFRDSGRFASVEPGLTSLAAEDPLATIIPLHRIIDDWLHSLNPYRLERLLGSEAISAALVAIRDEWQAVYPELFDLYLRDVAAFAREISGPADRAREFRRSRSAYVLQREIETLRTRLLRRTERSGPVRDRQDRIVLPMLAERLHNELIGIGRHVSLATLRRDDPVARRQVRILVDEPLIDYELYTDPRSYEYKPATRQLRRYIEARKQQPIAETGAYASLFPLDTVRSVCDLYRFLLRDPESFLMVSGSRLETAGPFEQAAWEEAENDSRDPGATLRIEFAEELSAQYRDQLTGLRDKNFFLERMPELYKRLRSDGKPITVLMFDIDHFKWINDHLGHQFGDKLLTAMGELVNANSRPADWTIRYGGEEILILIADDLNAGVVLAERLRYQQEQRIESNSDYEAVRRLASDGGAPCGTLSVGVAACGDLSEITAAVERTDAVLYAAKAQRNTVAVLPRETPEPLPYEEYRNQRLSASGVSGPQVAGGEPADDKGAPRHGLRNGGSDEPDRGADSTPQSSSGEAAAGGRGTPAAAPAETPEEERASRNRSSDRSSDRPGDSQ